MTFDQLFLFGTATDSELTLYTLFFTILGMLTLCDNWPNKYPKLGLICGCYVLICCSCGFFMVGKSIFSDNMISGIFSLFTLMLLSALNEGTKKKYQKQIEDIQLRNTELRDDYTQVKEDAGVYSLEKKISEYENKIEYLEERISAYKKSRDIRDLESQPNNKKGKK